MEQRRRGMIHEKIEIQRKDSEYKATLYTYFLDNSNEMHPEKKRPVIVICPGGGYEMTSDREAEPIAMRFLAMGYHAVVLRYSVYPAVYPEALLQVGETVKYLREHANEYHIDNNKIILLGFSAGGHLAGSFGVFWNRPFLEKELSVEQEMLRPNGMILCYPVITSGDKAHHSSIKHLLGERYEELKEEMALEKQVSKDTPKTFLWHTATDDCVPVENSLLFFQALHDHDIPVEMHIYPIGGHGLGLANEETSIPNGYGVQEECQSWISLVEDWLRHF